MANEAAQRAPAPRNEVALNPGALQKENRLLNSLGRLDSLLVAFSGGADSAYLAWAAHQALGPRALAVTALSASFSAHDREQAGSLARAVGLRHESIETHEFDNPQYVANNPDRCYHCKDELFEQMERLARERGFAAIAYGINADDTHDFRPGHLAAAEHKVLAPLLDAELTKAEIRALSRRAGLATWDRPASACLSSRIPYGTAVTREILDQIERGESVLRELGFRQFRVRAHGELARIEIASEEMARGLEPAVAKQISAKFRQIGFTYVTIDLEGYRQGSLNILLTKK
ncbi:MAG: ATP-dependent sacrificial sulfur transferase LarE [Candidatus Acidiferrales bacterium]